MTHTYGITYARAYFPHAVLRHVPRRAITLLSKALNAVLSGQYFPPAWKRARVVSMQKPGKDSMLPSSCRHIGLLDTLGKLFER
jgi:hypothetical protein